MAEPERHMDVPKERFSEAGPTHPPPKLKSATNKIRHGLTSPENKNEIYRRTRSPEKNRP